MTKVRFSGTILSLSIISVLLFFSYQLNISDSYSYMGFKNDFNLNKFIVGLFMLFLSMSYISFVRNAYYQFIIILLYVFLTLPNSILFIYMEQPYLIFVFSILSIPLTHIIMVYIPVLKVPLLTDIAKINVWIFLLTVCTSFVIIAHGFVLNFGVFLLEDIYEVRLAARENNNSFASYSYYWLAKCICPVGIVYGVMTKRYWMVFLSVLVLIYLYMIIGHKSVFLTIFIMLAFLMGENTFKAKVRLLLIGCMVVFGVSFALTYFFGITIIESLLVRRLFFIPALLNIYFFDFFEGNFIYYSNSILGVFLDYDYDLVPSRIIGTVYFGKEEMSANNGYLSDGYSNFGIPGILIVIFITSFVFKSIYKYQLQPRFAGIIFVTFYAFQGSALLTSFVTHGVLLLLILLAFFRLKKGK
jgi:hypothetical protein